MQSEELKTEIRNAVKDFKTEIKETYATHKPKVGQVMETIDRIGQVLSNAIEATKKDIPTPHVDSIFITAHLFVRNKGYNHHGLYIGDRKVLHYAKGHIHEISLDDFLGNLQWGIIRTRSRYPEEEIIQRANARLGEKKYNLIFNNCEHYVLWCTSGGKNHQVI